MSTEAQIGILVEHTEPDLAMLRTKGARALGHLNCTARLSWVCCPALVRS